VIKIKTLCILQVRTSSSRLPGKVMMLINGKPMIYWQIQRILQAKSIDKLIVATSLDSSDDLLAEFLNQEGVSIYRGSLDDVYSRFYNILSQEKPLTFLRLTGDCPLVMPALIDQMIEIFRKEKVDYFSNTIKPTFPDGLDVEIVDSAAFLRVSGLKLSDLEKEHVTIAMYSRPTEYLLGNFENSEDLSELRWTVDYQGDFDFVAKIFSHFAGREEKFGFDELRSFLAQSPELINIISGDLRNEGLNIEKN
jgi:spore coat polysaccharide biosynthesis protein SpsF